MSGFNLAKGQTYNFAVSGVTSEGDYTDIDVPLTYTIPGAPDSTPSSRDDGLGDPVRGLGVLTIGDAVTSIEMLSVEAVGSDDCVIKYNRRHSGALSLQGWKHHLYVNEDFGGPGYVGTYDEQASISYTLLEYEAQVNTGSCKAFGFDPRTVQGVLNFQVVLENIIDGKSYFSSRPEAVTLQ